MSGHTWEVGRHPAMSSGFIVHPVLMGSRVSVLPEWEGGHVVIKDERDARLIAAAPDLLEAAMGAWSIMEEVIERGHANDLFHERHRNLAAAIARATEAQP